MAATLTTYGDPLNTVASNIATWCSKIHELSDVVKLYVNLLEAEPPTLSKDQVPALLVRVGGMESAGGEMRSVTAGWGVLIQVYTKRQLDETAETTIKQIVGNLTQRIWAEALVQQPFDNIQTEVRGHEDNIAVSLESTDILYGFDFDGDEDDGAIMGLISFSLESDVCVSSVPYYEGIDGVLTSGARTLASNELFRNYEPLRGSPELADTRYVLKITSSDAALQSASAGVGLLITADTAADPTRTLTWAGGVAAASNATGVSYEVYKRSIDGR